MLDAFKSLFLRPERRAPAVPAGQRVYAVGDIHGRLDLLLEMIRAIEHDDSCREPALTTVILLGDLIDRGPDSAGVIAAAREWSRRRTVRVLTGNHEEMLLLALERDEAMRTFLRFGGRETLLSYPVDRDAFTAAGFAETRALLSAAIPAADLAYIRSFEDMVTIGDYLFVHAGIMPDQPLNEQRTGDLRWIREPFLGHLGDHGCFIVHGHTITGSAEIRPNRMGIDTGAYQSGQLTALGLEGTARWLIETREEDGAVLAQTRSIA